MAKVGVMVTTSPATVANWAHIPPPQASNFEQKD